jgi:predicted nucleic acid-binding protein
VKAWAKLEEESLARQFASIDEYLSGDDPSRLVLESLIDAMRSLPRSEEAIERIAKLKDRLRKVGKRERAERESERAGR